MSGGDPFANQESTGCFFCGSPSNLLCDGHLAWLSEDGKTISSKAKEFTCDRRLCRACVKESSTIHFNMKPKHQWDSRDYCRDCVKEERQFGGSGIHNGYQRRKSLVTESDGLALQARRKMFAIAAPAPKEPQP